MLLDYFIAGSFEDSKLQYVVIASRRGDKWIFVRHRERNTWELPAGHIEAGETAFEAAQRELFEETGALEYRLEELWDYCLSDSNPGGCGRIYFAEISSIGSLPVSEIAEATPFSDPPENLTYKEIQLEILERVKTFIGL